MAAIEIRQRPDYIAAMATVPTMASESGDPTASHASAVVEIALGQRPVAVRRFETGNQHYVYETMLSGGGSAVVRLSRQSDAEAARGAVYWHSRLLETGLPLPRLLHADVGMAAYPYPYIVMERLAGTDLGHVYDIMPRNRLRTLAATLFRYQRTVNRLPQGLGFGYATGYEPGAFPHSAWKDVITASLDRTRRRIRQAGVIAEEHVDRVEEAARGFEGYFDAVEPVPFLHDITTKNVLIHNERLSGIVDVDTLCFGDPLLLVALIRTALVAHGHDPVYWEYWLELHQPDKVQRAALDLYTAECCVGFMSEMGQRFNRDAPGPAEAGYLERLQSLLPQFLAGARP